LDALAPQPEGLARLGALGQVDLGASVQQGHPHFTAQGSGCHGDRDLAVQVVTVALEDRVLLDPDLDIEIPRRAAVDPGLSVARGADPHAVLDAGGDVDLEGLLLLDAALAVAGRAGIRDDLAAATAGRACLLDREEALLHAHAALPVAGVAGPGLRARLRARALAGGAAVPAGHADLRGVPVGCLLEGDLHRVAKVGTAIDVAAPARAARPEDVPEDVAEHVGEAARPPATAREAAGIRIDAGMAVAVVGIALGRVGQDLVGLLGLLELGLGRLVGRIAGGVVLHRGLPIGLLQVIGGRVPRHTQYVVKVTLGHWPFHAIRSSSRPFECVGDRRLATPVACQVVGPPARGRRVVDRA